MSRLPPPDPAAGNAASVAADEARAAVLAQVSAGTVDLAGLLAQVDAETGHRVLGHIHARAALLALPKIGEVKADEILDGLSIKHDEHLAELGSHERAAIAELVAAL